MLGYAKSKRGLVTPGEVHLTLINNPISKESPWRGGVRVLQRKRERFYLPMPITFIQSKSTCQHVEDMLKTFQWSRVCQPSQSLGMFSSFFGDSVWHYTTAVVMLLCSPRL